MDISPWIIVSVAVTLVSMALTGFIIPQILLIAFRRKLFDSTDERKIHHGSVPRLGGIAFVPAIFLSISFICGCSLFYNDWVLMGALLSYRALVMCFALCSLMLLYLVGMADDLVGVKYRAKFFVQVIAASLMVLSGQWIHSGFGLFGLGVLPDPVGWVLTVLLVVFVVNSINLIDGIDGLASGLSAIALLCYGVLFFMLRHYLLAMLCFATLGTLVPFFYFNVMGDAINKKKIFMGDTGSLTVGFILAFMAVEMTMSSPERVVSVNPMVLAFSPLLLPCFDVIRVFVHRLRMKQNPFLPDRCHIHHKLLALGMHQHAVMVVILFMSLGYAGLSIWLSKMMNVNLVFLIDFGSWIVLNYLLTRAILARQQRMDAKARIYG